MNPVLVFDLNGTLTDTASLDPFFVNLFGSADKRREWFTQMIELAMASSATGYYVPFSKFAESALQMLADRDGLSLIDEQRADLLDRVSRMPLFPDVEPGLKKLAEDGFRLAVLTNSALTSAESALERLGIAKNFERILSAEMAQCFKPFPQVYRAAARELKVTPGEMMMVAAHNWDTTGAIRAGCEAAFLTRPGEVLATTDPRPAVIASDLLDLPARLAAL